MKSLCCLLVAHLLHLVSLNLPSVKLTYPLKKKAFPIGNFIFQPSIFRGYVSFREGSCSKTVGGASILVGSHLNNSPSWSRTGSVVVNHLSVCLSYFTHVSPIFYQSFCEKNHPQPNYRFGITDFHHGNNPSPSLATSPSSRGSAQCNRSGRSEAKRRRKYSM